MKRVINETECVPNWYGVAYNSWVEQRMICYPLGIHILVGLLHTLYMEFRKPWFKANDTKYYYTHQNKHLKDLTLMFNAAIIEAGTLHIGPLALQKAHENMRIVRIDTIDGGIDFIVMEE